MSLFAINLSTKYSLKNFMEQYKEMYLDFFIQFCSAWFTNLTFCLICNSKGRYSLEIYFLKCLNEAVCMKDI